MHNIRAAPLGACTRDDAPTGRSGVAAVSAATPSGRLEKVGVIVKLGAGEASPYAPGRVTERMLSPLVASHRATREGAFQVQADAQVQHHAYSGACPASSGHRKPLLGSDDVNGWMRSHHDRGAVVLNELLVKCNGFLVARINFSLC
ncbi:uncharacterized protein CLUP02_08947 [Colletotrichum lupini]|uniref:Uncharacterized protein n=1 Tax=Colletotrichum lupini TaxID=145971 RepID=A0A9Q8WHY2_9PEZI|nr:uncharacterized protein CLUP02_08947 [Colletotrichum lupini]UQC83452.1 hypothetical protein CLUP02_08947 [Colletotrichum lupini]